MNSIPGEIHHPGWSAAALKIKIKFCETKEDANANGACLNFFSKRFLKCLIHIL